MKLSRSTMITLRSWQYVFMRVNCGSNSLFMMIYKKRTFIESTKIVATASTGALSESHLDTIIAHGKKSFSCITFILKQNSRFFFFILKLPVVVK